MVRFVFATLMLAILSTLPSFSLAVENGTRAIVSDLSYWAVITRLEAAIKRQKLKIVSRASVRGADRQKKLGIPGNMVIGAFDDDYTTRILRANVAAGIEAPIRFYVTRHADDKTTTLWYRRPSWVLAPYGDKTGDLQALGDELDRVMATIAEEATGSEKRTAPLLVKRDTGKRQAAKPATPKAPERVAKAAPAGAVETAEPAHVVTAPKPAAKRADTATKAVATAAPQPKATAATPRTLAAPKPLIPETPVAPAAAVKPVAPVARAAPKPLTAAGTTEAKPRQRAKAPLETARREASGASADAPVRKPAPPTAKRDPDRDAISLTPLMLRLQGQ